MADKHLSRSPTHMRLRYGEGEGWFYEDRAGLHIVVHNGPQFLISWKKVREAVKRKDKAPSAPKEKP